MRAGPGAPGRARGRVPGRLTALPRGGGVCPRPKRGVRDQGKNSVRLLLRGHKVQASERRAEAGRRKPGGDVLESALGTGRGLPRDFALGRARTGPPRGAAGSVTVAATARTLAEVGPALRWDSMRSRRADPGIPQCVPVQLQKALQLCGFQRLVTLNKK